MPGETQTIESSAELDALEQEFREFSEKAVSVVSVCTPEKESKVQQTMDFLVGTTRNPAFIYDRQLEVTEESVEAFSAEGEAILTRHPIPDKFREVYEKSIGRMIKRGELALAMRRYNEDKSPQTAAEVMRVNVELFGEPERDTYLSLLQDRVRELAGKQKSPSAERIFNELRSMLPESIEGERIERFKPSPETVAWVNQVVEALYGDMLVDVPEEREDIDPKELRDIFDKIITQKFGRSAAEWTVELNDVDNLYVDARKKKIFIPHNRRPLTTLEAKKLVVHEIGIHMLRAVMGGETNVGPLATGLEGSLADDEGLGKAMELGVAGEFKESGVDHYITAGLAYFEKKDFRDVFEIKWRMKLLQDLRPGEEPTPEQVQRARQLAVDGPEISTLRTFRGTNDLPLFINLTYYNGSVNIWKYLESIRGDDFQLGLLLGGNVSTSKDHQRVMLESSSSF